jgi:hypothetical protein
MRMVHYYAVLAILLVPSLLATLLTGVFRDGSDRHLLLGLFTAILCVATNTLLILFMIVTGRVLKAAMQSRPLSSAFLVELNTFFASQKAYPLALLAAAAATATAVLGYGRFIGVPAAVHMLLGLVSVLLNLWALQAGFLALRGNQRLLDAAAAELDRVDAERPEAVDPRVGEPAWVVGRRGRWLVFAASAWLPWLYWAFVVWRGDVRRVSHAFLWLSALASAFALWKALRPGADAPPQER